MKTIKNLIILLALGVIVALTSGYKSLTNPKDDIDALLKADKAWAEACTSKNLDKMISFYDIEACSIDPAGNILRGIDELRKLWSNSFASPDFSLTWQVNEAQVAKAGDIAYTIGSWDMTFPSQTGKQIKHHGTYVAIWKKQSNGTWKVLVDKS